MRWRGTGGVTSPTRSVPGSAPGKYVDLGYGPYWNDKVGEPPSTCFQVKSKESPDYFTTVDYEIYNVLGRPTTLKCQAGMAYIPFSRPSTEKTLFSGPDLEHYYGGDFPPYVGLLVLQIYFPSTLSYAIKTREEILKEVVPKMFTTVLPEYVVYDGHVYNFYNNWLPQTPGLITAPLYRINGWASNQIIETSTTLSARATLQKTPAGRWKGFHYSMCELAFNQLAAANMLDTFVNSIDNSPAGVNVRDNSAFPFPAVWQAGLDQLNRQFWSNFYSYNTFCEQAACYPWGAPFVFTPYNKTDKATSENYGLYCNAFGSRSWFGFKVEGDTLRNDYYRPFLGYDAYGHKPLNDEYHYYNYGDTLFFGCFEADTGVRTLCFDCPDCTPFYTGETDGTNIRYNIYELSEHECVSLIASRFYNPDRITLVSPVPEEMINECFDKREVSMLWVPTTTT